MNSISLVLYCLLAIYLLIALICAYGFSRTKPIDKKTSALPDPVKFSLIVCARNEEKHIVYCLRSIAAQAYPPNDFELILVDDASTDQTNSLAQELLQKVSFHYKIIKNDNQLGKKKSILKAIAEAKHPIVVSRDADTFTVSNTWLQAIANQYKQTGSDFIIAPVSIANHSGLLWGIQAVENNILTLFSAGTAYFDRPFLCSGANLSFTKKLFTKSGSYSSHLSVASGDDVLLLEDVKKLEGSRISFLKSKEAIVLTYPCLSFNALLQQKIRWASKFKHNPNPFNFLLAALVFLLNLGTLFAMAALPFVTFKFHLQLFVLLKLLIDILLLFLASTFIKNKNVLWYAVPVTLVYPVYACIIGIASLIVKPKWK